MKAQPVSNGFTLIELLVVMVIVSLTTSLLITGLNTTWNNFDKLLGQNLVTDQARVPASWFAQSVQGAQLYHPHHVAFTGSSDSMTFTSIAVPDERLNKPTRMRWTIQQAGADHTLSFSSGTRSAEIVIARFASLPYFEFLVGANWLTEFDQQAGRLPDAVRVIANAKVWSFATPARPTVADIPTELPVYGAYEF